MVDGHLLAEIGRGENVLVPLDDSDKGLLFAALTNALAVAFGVPVGTEYAGPTPEQPAPDEPDATGVVVPMRKRSHRPGDVQ